MLDVALHMGSLLIKGEETRDLASIFYIHVFDEILFSRFMYPILIELFLVLIPFK